MALIIVFLFLLFAYQTCGHMMCPTCIPLENLLVPGYGISVSAEGLSSAAAYHNGTTTTLNSVAGSDDYRSLMSRLLNEHDTYTPVTTALKCLARDWKAEQSPWDKDVLKLIRSYADYLSKSIKDAFSPSTNSEQPIPLHHIEQMIQDHLLALGPFASMSAEARLQATVAIQIPPWLIPSPHACSFRKVAGLTFGRVAGLESASSSAFTLLGHELCRVSQEAYECDGPGLLATFEYDGHLATASMIKTPLDIFDRMVTRYSTFTSQEPAELAKWIDSFLDRTSPDMITLAGPEIISSTFQEAINLSKAAGQIETNDLMKKAGLLVQGAAQVAKDAMENHNTDCSEFEECYDIRREADRIAGEYRYISPKVWPAVNNRHWRLERNIGPKSVSHDDQYLYGQLL